MSPELPSTVAFLVLVLYSLGLYLVLWLKKANVVRRCFFWYYEIALWSILAEVVATTAIVTRSQLEVWDPLLLVFLAPGAAFAVGLWLYGRFEATTTFLLYNAGTGDVEELNRIVARHIVSRTGPWVLQRETSRLVLVLGRSDAKNRDIRKELDEYLRAHGKRSRSVWTGLAVWGLVAVACAALLAAG